MRPKLKNKSDRYTENRNKYDNDTIKITIGGTSKNNADMLIYATVVLNDTSLIEKKEDNDYLQFYTATDKIEDSLTIKLGKVPNNIVRILVTIAPDSDFSRLYDINGHWIVESSLDNDSSRHEFYDYVTEGTKKLCMMEIIFNPNGTISIDRTK